MVNNMNKKIMSNYNKQLYVFLSLFIIISLVSIYSAETILSYNNHFFIKQIIWYSLGIVLIFLLTKIDNKIIYKYSIYLYILGNILLLLLLFFGNEVNNARCWFMIPYIGSFQPSEFMKIILIIVLSKTTSEFNQKYNSPTIKEEFIFLLKILGIVAIPSILTFLEPDTGVVLIYALITIFILFISGIRIRWFVLLFSAIILSIGIILGIYFLNKDLFIKILGTDFFLRVDRLLDWSNKSGYQLENGLIAIGSGGLLGHGFNHTPIYFPEPQTDFIFAVFSSNFGFIGSLILLILILFFDLNLINLAKSSNLINKYIIAGILGMLVYQQFQNIGMTLGIIPITGITLPFISYGGSSLLSYMIIVALTLNISKEKIS